MKRAVRAIIIAVILVLIILCISSLITNQGENIFKEYYYFDNNGTTDMPRCVVRAIERASHLGNASATYGTSAREKIDDLTLLVSNWLQLQSFHLVTFNSGASEGNNTIIRGVVEKHFATSGERGHIVLSAIEHKTSLECAELLQKAKMVDVTLVAPQPDGTITAADVAAAMRPNTILVSVMASNNETGTIMPIADITRAVKAINPLVIMHTDAVQSFGKYTLPISSIGLDALTMSFHKMQGPPGLGCLVLSELAVSRMNPLIAGSQNFALRGGTENIPAIAGAAEAMRYTLHNRHQKNLHLMAMKSYILGALSKRYKFGKFADYYGRSDDYSPSVTSDSDEIEIVPLGPACPKMANPNTLLLSIVKRGPLKQHFCNIQLKKDLLERKTIISIGSACNTSAPGASHVLMAIKAPYVIRCGVIRISLGDQNTMRDCKALVRNLIECIGLQTTRQSTK